MILRIPKDQYYFLMMLLRQGYPLLDCLEILQVDVLRVKEAFEQGIDIKQIFIQGKKERFYDHLSFFLELQDIAGAIDASLRMETFEKTVLQKLLKSSIYPTFILVFSYILLCFFTKFIIPQMMLSFQNQSMMFFMRSLNCFQQILTYCIFICFCCVCSYVLVSKNKTWKQYFYKRFYVYLYFHKDYASFLFAGYLKELLKQGISTRDSIIYLQMARKDSYFSYMISNILSSLEQGIDFIEVIRTSKYLNHRFKKLIPLGIVGSNIIETLDIFMKQQEYAWDRFRKKFTLYIQIITYVFVAILVLVVYQMMLIPLSMLDQFS